MAIDVKNGVTLDACRAQFRRGRSPQTRVNPWMRWVGPLQFDEDRFMRRSAKIARRSKFQKKFQFRRTTAQFPPRDTVIGSMKKGHGFVKPCPVGSNQGSA